MMRLIVSLLAVALITMMATATAPVRARLYDQGSAATELTPQTMGKFLSTHRPVCVFFGATWCGHCVSFKPAYEGFAKAMKDVVRVGAIDAGEHQAVAQQYQIQGFPTIKCWGMGNKKGKSPSDYVGPRTAAALQNHALGLIKGKTVTAMTKDDFDAAIEGASLKKAFVLFTNKDKVAPLYNVLSASPNYDGKIAFAVVKTSTKKGKELAGQLIGKDAKLPSMRLYSGDAEAVEYTGAVDYTTIAKYLLAVVKGEDAGGESQPAASGADSSSESAADASEDSAPPPPAEKKPPKRALPVEVGPITGAAITDFCSGTAIGRKQPFCVVVFPNENVVQADPRDVWQYFSSEPILFFTGDDAAFSSLTSHFKNKNTPQTSFAVRALIFRTAKEGGQTKFAWINAGESQELQNQIGQIFEGMLKLTKIDTLPSL